MGALTIYWYGVMMALGFLAGLGAWIFLGRKEGRSFTFCSDLLFWIMVSGIIGARLVYVASDLKYFLAEPLRILFIWKGGLIFYGGFIGASMGVLIFAKVRGENILDLFDFVITSVPLAHVFGRIGCFLNGCCYGRKYGGLFAVSFPADSYPWLGQVDVGRISSIARHSLPLHPVQLYEAAFNLVLYLLLIWAYRRRKKTGTVTALYLMIYPLARFGFEFLRGDERMPWMGLSVAQFVSIGLFTLGCGMLLWGHGRFQDRTSIEVK